MRSIHCSKRHHWLYTGCEQVTLHCAVHLQKVLLASGVPRRGGREAYASFFLDINKWLCQQHPKDWWPGRNKAGHKVFTRGQIWRCFPFKLASQWSPDCDHWNDSTQASTAFQSVCDHLPSMYQVPRERALESRASSTTNWATPPARFFASSLISPSPRHLTTSFSPRFFQSFLILSLLHPLDMMLSISSPITVV